jgi:sugar lactone lactonase YvrE
LFLGGGVFGAPPTHDRIQIFDQDGKFIAEWRRFGRPSGLYIDRNDILYSADSQSGEKFNASFRQGIRIGSVKDGMVTAFISEEGANPHMPEGVATDKDGNVFGGYTENQTVKKFVKK